MVPSQALADGKRHDAQPHTSTGACMPSHCATWQQVWHIHNFTTAAQEDNTRMPIIKYMDCETGKKLHEEEAELNQIYNK